jgi:hypothetical protein
MMKKWIFGTDNTTKSSFWEGRALYLNLVAAAIYLIVAGVALAHAVSSPTGKLEISSLSPCRRLTVIAVGFFISICPPAWFWIEARAFDDWVHNKVTAGLKDPEEKNLRETFKLNADGEKAFWASIVAVCAALLLKW